MLASLFFTALVASIVTAAPSQSPACGVSNNRRASTSLVSAAWYPGWASSSFPVSSVNWDKYTVLSYAFAVTTPDPSVISVDPSDAAVLPGFVEKAKEHGTVASISIGGWIGSGYFSSAVAPGNRSTFVKAVLDLVAKYNLDGVDFDWESPNSVGAGNQFSGADTDNFLAFLRELRAQPAGANLFITAAVGSSPWIGPNGQPVTDMSGFADVLDYIAIMNYDINAQYSIATGVGPNAPLEDSCSKVQNGSGIKAVRAWSAVGFPANKIVLGVPAYGHTYIVSPSNAIDGSGNLVDHPPFTQSATAEAKTFAELITQGFLNADGTAAGSVKYRWDDCSKTPFVYDEAKQLMVSYDDPKSFAAKGEFIIQNNLLGFAMWHAGDDHNDLLLNSITNSLG